MHAEDVCLKPTYVQHDQDTKFTASFDDVFMSADVTVKRTTPVSPNLNAHIERFVQTLGQECLDHFVIIEEKHLNHLTREIGLHYIGERAHSSRDHLPPAWTEKPAEVESIRLADVACETRLGGRLKHYWRRAASVLTERCAKKFKGSSVAEWIEFSPFEEGIEDLGLASESADGSVEFLMERGRAG